ncbi:MAG: hypothetical protein ABSG33_07465 [Candidatus Bathyarchaeia archaeon]|jgi:hypothetical protein
MKKSKYYEIAEIVVVLVTVTALIVWGFDQTKSLTLIYKGEKVGNTGFYFAGFTYTEAPRTTHLVLTAVFKPKSQYVGWTSEPAEDDWQLNPNGNTTNYLDYEFITSEYVTIVSYDVARQAIYVVFDGGPISSP